jgi:hypothetical protein
MSSTFDPVPFVPRSCAFSNLEGLSGIALLAPNVSRTILEDIDLVGLWYKVMYQKYSIHPKI